jgi:predicted lipid-binding transport protein (Tim44 family)
MNPSVLFEIVIFALIAFALVTKLLDMLGSINDEDQNASKSFFGEKSSSIKDVTNSGSSKSNRAFINGVINSVRKNIKSYEEVVAQDSPAEKVKVIKDLGKMVERIHGFDAVKFLEGAKSAFAMTIEALKAKDFKTLEYLVDKRFLNSLQNTDYLSFADGVSLLDAKICEVYSFGNSVFIKIRFSLSSSEKEEWVFTKNLLDTNSSAWQISSINVV